MTEPWRIKPPDQHHDTPDYRRYQRSLRLAQFQRELEVWQRGGQINHPRYAQKVAYRRLCLERWSEYLDGLIEPPEGRKPQL